MKIQNLALTLGDQFDVTVKFDQDISTASNLQLSIRKHPLAPGETDATAAARATTSNGGAIPVDDTHARFVIEHSVMRGLTDEEYHYDVQVTTAAGKPHTAVKGKLDLGWHATFDP